MRTEGEQLEALRGIQARLWKEHHLRGDIIATLGDVLELCVRETTRGAVYVTGGYDGWGSRNGKLGMYRSDMNEDEVVEWLAGRKVVAV